MIPGVDGRLTEEYLAHLKEAVNAELNPVKYLGIDPGKSNGVCGYDVKYHLMFMLTIHADDMIKFLHQFESIDRCITEGYRLYPQKIRQQIYSDLETPRVIGRIENWAENKKVELIIQPASIKITGYKWLGKKPPSKTDPKNHMMDANVHFMYWAIKNGKVSLRELLK